MLSSLDLFIIMTQQDYKYYDLEINGSMRKVVWWPVDPICQGGQHAQDEGGEQLAHNEAVDIWTKGVRKEEIDMFVWSFIYIVN